jgi:hypothetical protein
MKLYLGRIWLLLFVLITLLALNSCCPKLSPQLPETTTTIDTTKIKKELEGEVRYQDSLYYSARADSLIDVILGFLNKPKDTVKAPFPIYKNKSGGTTTTVSLYRDSLGVARFQVSAVTDSLLFWKKEYEELLIHRKDSTVQVIVKEKCPMVGSRFNHYVSWLAVLIVGIGVGFVVRKGK